MSPRVVLITDPAYDVVPCTEAALRAAAPGEVLVMVRDKVATARQIVELTRALLPIVRGAGGSVVVNGRCDIAVATGADGVHLPEDGLSVDDARRVLGPDRLVGRSRHGPGPGEGASYVTLGPVGRVPGKAPPMGVDGFRAACAAYRTPVYALGAVDAESAPALVRAGARGVAVIRAVYAAADPARALRGLLRATAQPV